MAIGTRHLGLDFATASSLANSQTGDVGPGLDAGNCNAEPFIDNADKAEFERYVGEQLQKLAAGVSCLTFPATLNAAQRKYIHESAKEQNLVSASTGAGQERRLQVFRPGAPNAPSGEFQPSPMSREEQLSRKLSSVLRHRAEDRGLAILQDGHVLLSEVLALPEFAFPGYTVKEVEELVREKDEKKRFQLRTMGGELWIRASQGHTMRSVQDSKLLQPIRRWEEVECCVHGTYLLAWDDILKTGGLSRMTRNHMHFAPRPPGADRVISGMRSDCEVAVYISLASAMDAGIPFFRSANDVILTPGDERGVLPCEHFERAEKLSDKTTLWPRVEASKDTEPPERHGQDGATGHAAERSPLCPEAGCDAPASSDDEEVVLCQAVLMSPS